MLFSIGELIDQEMTNNIIGPKERDEYRYTTITIRF